MFRIVITAIICALLIVYLKSINSELYTLSLIAGGLLILYLGIDYYSYTISFFNKIKEIVDIDNEYFKIMLKIISISYLVEFGASTIDDMGLNNLSNKLFLIGKLAIIACSLPIFYSVFELITSLEL